MNKKYLSFILILLCFLSYCNIFNNAFVSDDIPAILNNPQILNFKQYIFEPASLLNSFCYFIGKDNPFSYHLVSVILHSLNSVLLFFFLGLFFKKESAFLGAALFAVHPVHTEAVAWISGKSYLLSTFIILTGYLLYNRGLSSNKKFKVIYRLLGFAFFSFVVLALNFFLMRGIIINRMGEAAKDIGGIHRSNLVFNLAYSFFAHLKILLWPVKLTLYHEPSVISSKMLILELAALFVLFLSLPFIFKKAKEIFFAIMIFILFLAPTYSPIMISSLVAERYLYFPSIALSIIMAYVFEKVNALHLRGGPSCPPRTPTLTPGVRVVKSIFIVIIIFCIIRTLVRNAEWRTTNILWRKTVEVSPYSPRAHNNMGDVYAREGNISGALDEFRQAIKLQPGYADAYHNLANTYQSQGDLENAVKYYKEALTFNPELFESYRNLGGIYLGRKEFFLAEKYLQDALKLRPEDLNISEILNIIREKQSGRD